MLFSQIPYFKRFSFANRPKFISITIIHYQSPNGLLLSLPMIVFMCFIYFILYLILFYKVTRLREYQGVDPHFDTIARQYHDIVKVGLLFCKCIFVYIFECLYYNTKSCAEIGKHAMDNSPGWNGFELFTRSLQHVSEKFVSNQCKNLFIILLYW